MVLTDIIIKVVRIVVRVDDNLSGLDHFLVFVLLSGSVVSQGDVEIFNVDVLQQSQSVVLLLIIQPSTHVDTVCSSEDIFLSDGRPTTEVNVGVETLDLQRGHERELARLCWTPPDDLGRRRLEGGGLTERELPLHPVQDGEEALHALLQLCRPVDTGLLLLEH